MRHALARKQACGRVAARALIDGAALRAVLDDIRRGRIGPELARRRLIKANVAGKAAEALIQSFTPKPPKEGRP